LDNPNKFEFRFLGIFPDGNNGTEISIFDFINYSADDLHRQKIDSKAVFEDSVLNFYCNRVAQSLAGFHNVLKLYPADRASMKYIERGNRILSIEEGSILL